MKRVWWAAAFLTLVLLACLVWVAIQIERQSVSEEARAADVIVIMGAAEYGGKPSPVLRARLDHGLELYRRGLAPRILTTGGAGGDPVFTEGEVGRSYLVRQGVRSEDIIVEQEGESTVHSTAAVAEIMRRMNLRSLILVSDGYHIYRTKKMLEFRGLTVFGSPRSSPTDTGLRAWWIYTRQALAYFLWSVGIKI
jgi:uncharacterized SAM-binding protein YcdF (DUF218 family)